jgi:hypothetical protein
MKILLSGEGPTDLGACNHTLGQCAGDDLRIGPMTVLVAQLVEPLLGFDLLEYRDCLHYISETALCEQTKAMPRRMQPARSKKKGVETSYFFGNAMTLGRIAHEMGQASEEPLVAVLFRDSDGTRQQSPARWDTKRQSMQDGFRAADFEFGVPMLPKPKSEAWLIGAASPSRLQCGELEDLPGNDASPRCAKSQLDAVLGRHFVAEELCDWLKEHPVDARCMQRLSTMPSFKAFHDDLTDAIRRVLH